MVIQSTQDKLAHMDIFKTQIIWGRVYAQIIILNLLPVPTPIYIWSQYHKNTKLTKKYPNSKKKYLKNIFDRNFQRQQSENKCRHHISYLFKFSSMLKGNERADLLSTWSWNFNTLQHKLTSSIKICHLATITQGFPRIPEFLHDVCFA